MDKPERIFKCDEIGLALDVKTEKVSCIKSKQ